jgi:hypothetical protein
MKKKAVVFAGLVFCWVTVIQANAEMKITPSGVTTPNNQGALRLSGNFWHEDSSNPPLGAVISGTNTNNYEDYSSGGYFSAVSPFGYGIHAYASGSSGRGIYSAASGSRGYGVYGSASGSLGRGVYGVATNTGESVTNYGGYFAALGEGGRGVYGTASGTNGWGVYGNATNTGNVTNYGGIFAAHGSSGFGVRGYASGNSGTGVYGLADGDNCKGIHGEATNTANVTNYGGHFSAYGWTGRGVYAKAIGVTGYAVYGEATSTASNAVNYGGYFSAAGAEGTGVYGKATGNDGIGVYGEALGGDGIGVCGNGEDFDFFADGPGTNYGAFTGAHEVKLEQGMPEEALSGRIVSVTGKSETRKDENGNISLSSTLPTVALSIKAKDKAVLGVMVSQGPLPHSAWYEAKDGEHFGIVNALGEGRVWVTDINGEIEAGDYITTSIIPGYGQMQEDDILHSYTLGKAIETVDWDQVTETIHHEGKTYRRYLLAVVYTSG